jgi:hypothetical protein
LVDRRDDQDPDATYDFDIVFNYDPASWEFGLFSDDLSPLAGFSNPYGWVENTVAFGDSTLYELPGSGQSGAFLAGGSHDLAANSHNSDVLGRYIFEFRGGDFVNRPSEEPTLLLLISGLFSLPFARRIFNN